jgi:acyl phosphate:glycerol-3-phosphate acyltransferase
MLVALVLVALGFGLGSIPFGVLIARRKGVDIQRQGSGNIGATNVTRVLGAGAGALVLVLDAAKGALPVVIARGIVDEPWIVALVGYAAILGHCFSPLLGGRGGKGVATALGVFAVLVPELVAVGAGVFAVVLGLSRVPALGSLAAVLAITGALVARGDRPLATLACATFVLLVYTHRTNLAGLTSARR